MLNFTRDYPKAETVLLDVNYRCSGQILKTAMKVIDQNEKRFSKSSPLGMKRGARSVCGNFPIRGGVSSGGTGVKNALG